MKHAMSPAGAPGYREHRPRCGAESSAVALFAEDVTCPACTKLMNSAALRSGVRQAVEKGQSAVGLAVMDLCVWEGRGDWGSLPAENRDQSGRQAVKHLEQAIAMLETQRDQLLAVLKMEGNSPE